MANRSVQCLVIAILLLPGSALAASFESRRCGVEAVYAAAVFLGRSASVTSDLISAKFVSRADGSTLEDLRRAATACGLVAKPIQGMTPASLRTSVVPVVLHVRGRLFAAAHDHYLLYMGVEAGKARLFDGRHIGHYLPEVSKPETVRLIEQGALIIDARQPADYVAGHIKGSMNVRLICLSTSGIPR